MVTHSVDLASGITESFFTNIYQLAGENFVLRKRLTEITIELLQNIRSHAAGSAAATLSIKKYDTEFRIEASNPVSFRAINDLRNKIGYMNTLDSAQLKKQHTRLLRESRRSEKSGAGLGFYRIAMRARSALNASFIQTDQELYTFTLHINLPS